MDGISLKVDVAQVKQGANALDNFANSADRATGSADKFESANSSLASSMGKAKQGAIDASVGQDKLAEAYFKQIDKIKNTANATTKLLEIQKKVREDSKNLGEGNTNALLLDISASHKKAEAIQKALTTQKERFIRALKEEAATMNMSKAELLSYRATQLGVLDQADIYIKQLNNQANALNLAGLSHKQYQQAMRFLPMQITDVVTSLASGMPVWMIAIQQGGQIKDSFGGVSNTFKALMSLITPSKLAIAGAAGGLAVLAKAYYDATVNANELNRAIAITGNYASTDVGRITEDARLIAESVGNVSLAKTALSKTIEKGIFDPSEFNLIAKSAVEMEQATGKALDETINEFAKLQDAPAKTLAELNKQMHFLTQAEYDHVKALEKSGNKAEAASEAQRLYSKALADVSANVEKNLTSLEKSIKSIKNDASNMWQSFADSDRTGSAVYAALTAALIGASLWSGKFAINSVKGSIDSVRARKQETNAAIEATRAEQAKYLQRQKTLTQHAQIRAQQLAEAEAQFKSSAGTKNATSAEIALEQARRRAIATNKALEASNLSLANAQNAVSRAERSAAILNRAGRGLSASFGLLGGPMGVVTLASSALMYWWQQADAARQSAIDLANDTDNLKKSMQELTSVQLASKILDWQENLQTLESEADKATKRVNELKKELKLRNTPLTLSEIGKGSYSDRSYEMSLKTEKQLNEELTKALAEQETARNNVRSITDLLTLSSQKLAHSSGMVIDSVTGESRAASPLEKIIVDLGEALKSATDGKRAFNSFQLDTSEDINQADQLITKLTRMNEVLAEQNKAKQESIKLDHELQDANATPDQSRTAHNLLNQQLLISSLNGLNGYFKDWGDRNKEASKPKAGGYKDSAGTSLLLEAQKRYEVLQAELRTLATQGLAYEKMTEDRKKLVELDAQSALLREKAAKEGLTKEQQSILAMNDQLRAQYELNAIESERLNGRKDALQVEKSIADKMIEIRQSIMQINGAKGLSALENAEWSEKNQAKIDFERAGGDISDLNSSATQAYLKNLDLIEQKHIAIREAQRDWKSAFSSGIKDWIDETSNVVKSTDEIIDTSMNGAISNLSLALQGSVVDWKSWGVSVLSMIGEVITKLAVASAMQSAMGALGGGGKPSVSGSVINLTNSVLSMIPGFASGGFTGYGDKYEPAGVVHRDEFVFNKEATRRIGVDNLYRLMNQAQKGYAQGGLVGGSPFIVPSPNVDMMRSMGNQNITLSINIENVNSGEPVQQSSSQGINPIATKQQFEAGVMSLIQRACGQGGYISNFVQNKKGR